MIRRVSHARGPLGTKWKRTPRPKERHSVGWKGWVWWVVTSPTKQPQPSPTGPCERFMRLNIKACRLQRWRVDVYSPLMFQPGCECTPQELGYCMWIMTLPKERMSRDFTGSDSQFFVFFLGSFILLPLRFYHTHTSVNLFLCSYICLHHCGNSWVVTRHGYS